MRWSLGEESLCLSQCSWTLAFSESHGRRVLGFFCQGEASELQQDWCAMSVHVLMCLPTPLR